MRSLIAQLAPHLPANPQKQDAAGQQQTDHLQQLSRNTGEDDAQASGGNDTDDDSAPALLGGQARRGKADDDGVVAGQHEVDQDDLEQRGQRVGGHEFSHDRSFLGSGRIEPVRLAALDPVEDL